MSEDIISFPCKQIFTTKIIFKMRDLVWIIIVILIVGWLLGFIGFGAVVGNLIHILLIVAVVLIVLKLLQKI